MSNSSDELRELYKTVRHNSRMILYNDPIGRPDDDNQREQVGRDDMWAVSTEELDRFMQLIESHTQQAVVEARKQELTKVYGLFGAPKQRRTNITTDFTSYVDNRIAELTNKESE